MKIYLVTINRWDDECSHSTSIKAFVDRSIAELYIVELEEKSKKYREELKAIYHDFEDKEKNLYAKLKYNVSYKKTGRKRKTYNETLEKMANLSLIRYRKEQELKAKYEVNEKDFLITDPEYEEFIIEEIDLDERKNDIKKT